MRVLAALGLLGFSCDSPSARWKFAEPLSDPALEPEIVRALDAASEAGTYPPLSGRGALRGAMSIERAALLHWRRRLR